jgi:hypothetical protein
MRKIDRRRTATWRVIVMLTSALSVAPKTVSAKTTSVELTESDLGQISDGPIIYAPSAMDR